MATGLFLFQNDLRLHDNPALKLAASEMDNLICVYCLPYDRANRYPYGITRLGPHRLQFLLQSLDNLAEQLEQHRQHLHVLLEHPLNILPTLITKHNISAIYSNEQTGTYEQRNWQTLKGRYPYIQFFSVASQTLFDRTELPFHITQLPDSFAHFNAQVEGLCITPPVSEICALPPAPSSSRPFDILGPLINQQTSHLFSGGEQAGLKQLLNYQLAFDPSDDKASYNQLDDLSISSHMSPWLALGCVSPKTMLSTLNTAQPVNGTADHPADSPLLLIESMKKALLIREYRHWSAHYLGPTLFAFKGIKSHGPHTAFYPERFRRWCEGNTPFPLVNALMNQLRQTGYLSHCGRQIVASCLVNELSVDWRYGASFFEEHLIDYDVAVNWGNWQCIAGVGTEPADPQPFNIEQQTARYDPDGQFIRKWGGDNHDGNLDSVDAADWPIW
ncbi:DASH family cryptochrome [Photobacterium nomapromontoriensis]|uniref:DASH family cryptochrome n=1 Tax=Photobacterium nomapromontoriensis TaxID=2910237 RepID=UPI003D11AB78